MASFRPFTPIRGSPPVTLDTTAPHEDQLWQELVHLRYGRQQRPVWARRATAPWVDQAKVYYLDARQSQWRSAGLLYYYSFLNLAKALLVTKRAFPFKSLAATAVHHGLSAGLQPITRLTDYIIQIYPPVSHAGGTKNVFSNLYEVLTGVPWPFATKVVLTVGEFSGYCRSVSAEFSSLFGVQSQVLDLGSVLLTETKADSETSWLEIAVESRSTQEVSELLAGWPHETRSFGELTSDDYNRWHWGLGWPPAILRNFSFLRTAEADRGPAAAVIEAAVAHIGAYASLAPMAAQHAHWHLVFPLSIRGRTLPWSPLLSHYLISFALSTILRYQPQLLLAGSENSFAAEAWCSQSAVEALSHFLVAFTDPPIVVMRR